jgi:HAD superfamily hydrolase (TIGR01509 family)
MLNGTAIRGVIFDLGSTLIHRTGLELERQKCAAVAAFAASELGFADPDALAARLLEIRLNAWRRAEAEQVEQLAVRSIAQAFRERGIATDDGSVRRAESVFFQPEVRASRLYPGAQELLNTLVSMGLRLGMISNATSHQLILDITRRVGIETYFNPLVSSAAFGRTKPHPSIFTHVLEAWEVPAAQAVMVGDTLSADILGAHGVGMRSILVDIEPNPANARAAVPVQPTARITRLPEIPDLLRRWTEG